MRKYPESTPDTLYIMDFGDDSLGDVVNRAIIHFPDVPITDLIIRSDEIQVDCFGYDVYDPCDWCDYFIIERRAM